MKIKEACKITVKSSLIIRLEKLLISITPTKISDSGLKEPEKYYQINAAISKNRKPKV